MKPFTAGIIKFLRYTFLVVSMAAALALSYYLYLAFFAPKQPGDVVTLNVRQATVSWDSPLLDDAEQRVAAGASAQLVQRGTTASLVYQEPSPGRRLLLRLMNSQPQPVPYVLATLAFCVLLYLILRDIKPGVPFTPANVQRLRWLGALLIACDLYKWTATWWMRNYLTEVAPAGATNLLPYTHFSSSLVANWLIGLLLLIIAAGYQRGVELAEEADLTV